MSFEFRIEEINSGWLDVILAGGNGRAIVTNSNYLGNDAPKILLQELYSLSQKEEGKTWLLWNDEPGGYLWRLEKKGELLQFQVGECAGEEEEIEDLPFYGNELSSCRMEEVFLKDRLPFQEFAEGVISAFLPFFAGEKKAEYELEWDMEFPENEMKKLLKIFPIGSISLKNILK